MINIIIVFSTKIHYVDMNNHEKEKKKMNQRIYSQRIC